jgi:hypothetical protein
VRKLCGFNCLQKNLSICILCILQWKDPYHGNRDSSGNFNDMLGKAGAAIAGALGTAGILGALTGKKGDVSYLAVARVSAIGLN